MANRVHSSDIEVFVNGQRIPAISSVSINTSKEVERIRRLGEVNISEQVLTSNQTTSLQMENLLTTGATGFVLFYSYQQMQSGFLSTGKFDFEIKDIVGVTTIKEASLVNYTLDGSIGELVKGSTSYEGNTKTFTSVGATTPSTNDYFGGFFRPKDIEITTTTAGSEGIETASLNIQSFSLSVSTPRTAINRLGTRTPKFRYPEIPAQGSLNFEVIKNKVTGMDMSSLICESGVIKINLKNDNEASVMNFITSGCCLESVDESTSLDDNTQLTFSYYFPILQ